MNVSCLIVGIDGWDQYTAPLFASIREHEPDAALVVIDNASADPYPKLSQVYRTDRLCYSAAINVAWRAAPPSDWYIVLSNDVLCRGPFVHMLEPLAATVAGPALMQNQGWTYIEGWCVAAPVDVWTALSGWDERFQVSSWEDVDFSTTALENGYTLTHLDLPFVHLDQKQRFSLVSDYWGSEVANMAYFASKHSRRLEYTRR
jgi:hypothetical protein